MRNLMIALMLFPLLLTSVALAQGEKPEPEETTPPPFKVELKLPGAADIKWPPVERVLPPLQLDLSLAAPPQEAPYKPRQRIGIKMGAVEAPLAAHLGVEPEGVVLLLDVIAGSAAQKAGLQRYDVITHLDGKAPVTNATLIAAVQGKKPGDTLDLRILRRARATEIAVKIAAPPTRATTDESGRFSIGGIVPGHYYVTTTAKKEGTYLYVTPQVSHRYVTDLTWAEPMNQQKLLDRLAEMEKRLARMEKLLEEVRER